ncbi:TPA: hypothetical protein ACGQSM_003694 [Serratia liquefaciens]
MTQTLTTKVLNDFITGQGYGVAPSAVEAMARELLANREAQPVGRVNLTKIAAELVLGDYLNSLWHEAETSKHISTHRLQNLLDELHEVMKVKAIALTQVITAPPAPAVPEEMTGSIAMTQYRIKPSNYKQWVKGYNACRAAMLAAAPDGGN